MRVVAVPDQSEEAASSDQSAMKVKADVRLTPEEVVDRWRNRVNTRTLANWRSSGNGPRFTKVGNRILYPLKAVQEYEERRDYGSTKDYGKEKN